MTCIHFQHSSLIEKKIHVRNNFPCKAHAVVCILGTIKHFFIFLSKALSRVNFSILFRVSNHQIVGKEY